MHGNGGRLSRANMGPVDDRFINRELSWLAFNDRVLQLASESGIPLLERCKFCAITTTNLDEFFQVRVAALKDQVAAGIEEPTADGRTAPHQLAEIAELRPRAGCPPGCRSSSSSWSRRWPRRASPSSAGTTSTRPTASG